MGFQVLSEKPAHMLEQPGPGIVSQPSLLNSRLHDSSASSPLPRRMSTGQSAGQKEKGPTCKSLCSARLCPGLWEELAQSRTIEHPCPQPQSLAFYHYFPSTRNKSQRTSKRLRSPTAGIKLASISSGTGM